ncbi:hypothetical protein [Antarctobacter heliothermus]|uniref:Uncharacterized protein n=1 Tax=Antarctobacter heliothermus TaxID=74033 RepID=A0A239AVG5_9RHOB|nr:hypothetical protein [Antarctobacter heliothermus]SNR98963.1 hypothetical protein SAMN04488078_1001122 [Antarctobacter heliothermus]
MIKRGLVLCALLVPGAALADEISGEWCSPDGQSLTIRDNRVVAPSGIETDGRYSRHRYEFTMPEGGADAGAAIVLQQRSEEEVLYSIDGSTPVSWTRCRAVTS